jgi:putative methionine-R-sulfoxide reductase with GAF domain
MKLEPDSAGNQLRQELDQLIGSEPEADRVLRATTAIVTQALSSVQWVGIYVTEDGELELGPAAGLKDGAPEPAPSLDQPRSQLVSIDLSELAVPVVYDGTVVGLILARTETTGDEQQWLVGLLEMVAERISSHCLVGWDTGGVEWENVS